MAKRVEKKVKAARGGRAAAAKAQELEVLHPEQSVTIAGRKVTVREYGFVEGLAVRAIAKPLTDAMYAQAGAGGNAPLFDQIGHVLGTHPELAVDLIARSADVDAEWIGSLNDQDGQSLLLTWWMVNSGFFIRPLLMRLAGEKLQASQSAGDASTPPSSAPASDAAPPTSGS